MLLEFDELEYKEALEYVQKHSSGELVARVCGVDESDHFLELIIGRPNIVYDGTTIYIRKTGDTKQVLPFYLETPYHLLLAGEWTTLNALDSDARIHLCYKNADLTIDEEGWLSVLLTLIDGTVCRMTYTEFSGY